MKCPPEGWLYEITPARKFFSNLICEAAGYGVGTPVYYFG